MRPRRKSSPRRTPPGSTALPSTSAFYFGGRVVSFDERFTATAVSFGHVPFTAAEAEQLAVSMPPQHPAMQETARAAVGRPAPQLASISPLPPAGKKRVLAAEPRTDSVSPLDIGARTAIYDIAARTVYLPDGRRLEAHSGLDNHLDDPRYVSVKHRGPTPPNVYDLALRERLFHGVRAIRLIPVDSGKMFGRDGMLAHSYMLGPNGQSNGCVSFSDYPVFLNAFLKGEVDRLVVVEQLATAPDPKAGSAWFSEALKNLFKPSDRAART